MKDKLTTDFNTEINRIKPKEKSEAFRGTYPAVYLYSELEQLEQSVSDSETQVQQM